MDLKYCEIDVENSSIKELENELMKMERKMWDAYNLQYAIKILLNSSYGVIGNKYFICYNKDVAESITLQGQDIIIYSAKMINKYFHEYWYDDEELHQKLGIEVTKPVENEMVVYGDTDSCVCDTVIHTENGDFTIETLFNNESRNAKYIEKSFNKECIMPNNLKILNWDNDLKFDNVKYIYRHKVKKKKWKLKTKSGKEIIVTNDHSLIVFRNGKKIKVKASEVIQTDKILTVSPEKF